MTADTPPPTPESAGSMWAAPATRGAALLATARLTEVMAGRDRHRAAADPEALHDFRVALRRLRSVLRAYRRPLRAQVPDRVRRRLRRIARATGVSRDIEVQLIWLESQREGLRPRDRTGLRWLVARLRAAKQQADVAAEVRLDRSLPAVTGDLEQRLRQAAMADPDDGEVTLADVTADRLEGYVRRFARRMATVRALEHQDEAHAARIAGKRVRYLLEPIIASESLAADLLPSFKGIQDLLGDMHDAEVLERTITRAIGDAAVERAERIAEAIGSGAGGDRDAVRRIRRRDPAPGLLTLGALAQANKVDCYHRFRVEWLPVVEQLFVTPISDLAARLAARHGADMEYERKYLLREVPPAVATHTPLVLEQGYLPGDRIQERIRRQQGPAGTTCLRTLKAGRGVSRIEIEEEITDQLFEQLWPVTAGRRVQKRRYRIPAGTLVWEIDVFDDRDLVLAEVELPSPDVVPSLPDWLAPSVVREVTEEPAYLNIKLAR